MGIQINIFFQIRQTQWEISIILMQYEFKIKTNEGNSYEMKELIVNAESLE